MKSLSQLYFFVYIVGEEVIDYFVTDKEVYAPKDFKAWWSDCPEIVFCHNLTPYNVIQ
ncbi:hypothetical protein NEOCIP111885_03656 [Pseudoneobacillus rhizosphaerae]|uniref:Uncharacterized protein n=1 Tax=Pseudoneobacillus rhizosphaerae TaxID=2880968 RepID=A0A9C7GCR9_9BACI|nr:hypothetical protein NEOCIP111885_03656 [Pseudoneobacillus rhizosphaerae]